MKNETGDASLSPDDTAIADDLGRAAALAIADNFAKRGLGRDYQMKLACAGASDDFTKGAVHFGEMAERGFKEEVARLRSGTPRPDDDMPLCEQLGAAMTHLDFDDFERRLNCHMDGLVVEPSQKQRGIFAAARACGRTYQIAAVEALQHRSRTEADPADGLRAALLAGPVHVAELTHLLDIDQDELDELAIKVCAESGDEHMWLSDASRAVALSGVLASS